MPNNVTNNLHICGPQDVLKEIQACHLNDGVFDFNTLIPRPVSMNITSGSRVKECAEYLLSRPGRIEEIRQLTASPNAIRLIAILQGDFTFGCLVKHITDIEEVIKQFEEGTIHNLNIEKYGFSDWYGWNNNHWMTKWNGYSGHSYLNSEELFISFDSAWSPPAPVIQELSELYPEVSITHCYIDESGGGFAGTNQYDHGQYIHHDHIDNYDIFAEEEFGWGDPKEEDRLETEDN